MFIEVFVIFGSK